MARLKLFFFLCGSPVPYTYTCLQDNQIRLLKLDPGATDSPIICSLQTVNLQDYDDISGKAKIHDIKSYDAISYVWGSNKSVFEIDCDGKSANIGVGLRAALNRIRDPCSVRLLWADALCINQQDDKERANQVKLMGLIYWKAQKVHIYLGPGEHEKEYHALKTAGAVDVIRKLGCPSRRSSMPGPAMFTSKPFLFSLKSSAEFLHHRQWNDVRDMFERPWFKRVWVVQELGLSKDAIFYYGCSSFTRDELDDFLAYLYSTASANISRYNLDLRILRIASHYRDTTRGGRRLEFGSDPSLAESFLDVLEGARGLHCSDPRDGIYAFLGHPAAFKKHFLDDDPYMWYPRNYNSSKKIFLKPDYSRANSLAQLYLDVATIAMRKLPHNLTILCHVAHIKETLAERYPSWIPRWDLGDEPSLFYKHRGHDVFYAASGKLQHTTLDTILANESYGDHKLKLNALPLGTIQFKHNHPTSGSFAAVAHKFLTDLNALTKHGKSDKKGTRLIPISHRMVPLNLAITLTAGYTTDSEFLERPAEEDSQRHFDMFRAYLRRECAKRKPFFRASIADDDDADLYVRQLRKVAIQRAFFCTTNGYFGLGPLLLREGDEIWLPMGAKMPFVFRRIGAGLFKILGQTYLHGVMRGEAVAGLTEQDFQKVTLS